MTRKRVVERQRISSHARRKLAQQLAKRGCGLRCLLQFEQCGPFSECGLSFHFVCVPLSFVKSFRRSEGGACLHFKELEAEHVSMLLLLFLACVWKVSSNCFNVLS